MWNGSNKFFRRGLWNGITFSGALDASHNSVFEVNFVYNEDELYYAFKMIDKSIFSMAVLNKTRSSLELLTWSQTTQNWNVYSYVPRDQCDSYGLCGVYGNCITTQLLSCQCLEGFKPKSTGYREWSQGCMRNKVLNYSKLDGFIKFNGLKSPDATNSWVNKSMNLEQCRVKCLENTSCMAYSNFDIRGRGSGCAMWFGDLIDIKQSSNNVQDLFIRMSASELGWFRLRNLLPRGQRVLGFLICSGVLSSVLDFDLGSIDGFGKFSVTVLMSCVVAFLYMPGGKNARSFWLGSDQLRSNLEIFSRG
ncbi:hypothetical protein LWI29_020154 [Acer saccharum]|uniref:Apple domain-containing protein n=1 Tax=Acer saccharum TaxID=4024 RepID=A0AA39T4C2_ACESA|nr:hypothetical protein LWI29_020154 [Acer saccharum]